MSYQVLLFYKYIPLPNPEEIRDQQRQLCERLDLKGRIIVASEGINGTAEGTIEDTESYILEMEKNPLFKGIIYKKSAGTGQAFPKLSVKSRKEIVRLGVDIDPNKVSGKYLSAEELHSWFEKGKRFFIVDMRNDYEYLSGYFEGSVLANIHNFFDLPKAVDKLAHLKGETIVTVCTGGVRCEKASGLLIQNGFEDVYQLKDGIQTYMERFPNKHFKGKLYVFDNRLTLGFNTDDSSHQIVGNCMHCGVSCDSYVNCAYDICHYHYLCCERCKDPETNLAFCKIECQKKFLSQKGSGSQLPMVGDGKPVGFVS
jgi:UPF0176 protein